MDDEVDALKKVEVELELAGNPEVVLTPGSFSTDINFRATYTRCFKSSVPFYCSG